MQTSAAPTTQADAEEDAMALPGFIVKRPDGVFVNPSRMPDAESFVRYVDHLFTSGVRFADLNYPVFSMLIHSSPPQPESAGELLLAGDIVRFNAQRRDLYKGVKISDDGANAVYVFAPAMLEVAYQEPVYGDPDENGVTPILSYQNKTRQQPTKLDIDEFVAEMWLKGLRFGIAVDAVSKMIASGQSGRLEIAAQLLPTGGRDAEIQEASDVLRRDDSPKILASGRTDLRRFKNRFPQVAKGAPLLRKIPRELGRNGRKVTGEVVEPAIPEDIDLQALSGPGTHIERKDGLDYIVASIEGFLTLDLGSNQVSVTEKIENRGGISARTTGDLALAVDEFIEHGEVQEGRVVQGRHMTFRSDVYGSIVSDGGNIVIDSNLSGGSARSAGGDVTVHGRASNAQLEAWDGTVTAGFAESSLIIGKRVVVERAVNCTIIADDLQLGVSEGCAIAGKGVGVTTSNARKDKETVISILVPDISAFDHQAAAVRESRAQMQAALDAKSREIESAKGEPEFAKFLALEARIRQGSVKLTDEQQGNWQKMVARFAAPFKQLAALNADRQGLQKKWEQAGQELERIAHDREQSAAGLYCRIAEVAGETVVRRLDSNTGINAFREVSATELRTRLRNFGTSQERLFSGAHGSVDWHFELPELDAS